MDTCLYCNPASTHGYDSELFCEEHLHHAEGMGGIFRSATVNRKIGEAFLAWRLGDDARAGDLLRYAAVHSKSGTRSQVARIAALLATDFTETDGAIGYLAVVEICQG